MTTHILFVCTGNTCRSQMAQAIAQQLASQYAWPISCTSAGIRAIAGEATTVEARKVLNQHGIHWQGSSQLLTTEALLTADHVWVMTPEHLAFAQGLLLNKAPSQWPKMRLLAPEEVPDPLGCGYDAYVHLYAYLRDLLPGSLKALVL